MGRKRRTDGKEGGNTRRRRAGFIWASAKNHAAEEDQNPSSFTRLFPPSNSLSSPLTTRLLKDLSTPSTVWPSLRTASGPSSTGQPRDPSAMDPLSVMASMLQREGAGQEGKRAQKVTKVVLGGKEAEAKERAKGKDGWAQAARRLVFLHSPVLLEGAVGPRRQPDGSPEQGYSHLRPSGGGGDGKFGVRRASTRAGLHTQHKREGNAHTTRRPPPRAHYVPPIAHALTASAA